MARIVLAKQKIYILPRSRGVVVPSYIPARDAYGEPGKRVYVTREGAPEGHWTILMEDGDVVALDGVSIKAHIESEKDALGKPRYEDGSTGKDLLEAAYKRAEQFAAQNGDGA